MIRPMILAVLLLPSETAASPAQEICRNYFAAAAEIMVRRQHGRSFEETMALAEAMPKDNFFYPFGIAMVLDAYTFPVAEAGEERDDVIFSFAWAQENLCLENIQ